LDLGENETSSGDGLAEDDEHDDTPYGDENTLGGESNDFITFTKERESMKKNIYNTHKQKNKNKKPRKHTQQT
jgi:hypothetical protein